MHVRRFRMAACLMALALLLSLLPLGLPAIAQSEGEVVAEGLNGPMGVLVDPDGNIWAIDSGLGGDEAIAAVNAETGETVDATVGQTTRIVKIDAGDGSLAEIAAAVSVASDGGVSGGGRLALLDGVLYASVGEWLADPDSSPPAGVGTIIQVNDDGSTSEVAAFWPFERDVNPYPPVLHAHPYGIIGGPDGMLWVADAGGNYLGKVDPASGEISVVAVFEPLPGVFPRPEYDMELLTDPVPTAVTVGADGGIYVSLLSGAPFVPGSAKVMAVADDGSISDYATGLTMLTDLRTGPDGNLYATQFGVFTEQGPQPASGAVIRIREGGDSEVVASGLSFATSLDFNEAGDAYVAINGVGPPGSGQIIKLAGLTAAEGVPVAEVMAAMGPPPTEGDGEAMADATPAATEEAMEESSEEMAADATPAATEEAMEEKEAASSTGGPAPTTLPVTGAATGSLPVGVAGLLLAALIGAAVVSQRKRTL